MLRYLLMGTTAIARVPDQPKPYITEPFYGYRSSDGYFFDIETVRA